MTAEFVNAYIERLVKEVGELTRIKLLLETQLSFTESQNNKLSERITTLEEQVEKQNKKKPKEVNTSDTF